MANDGIRELMGLDELFSGKVDFESLQAVIDAASVLPVDVSTFELNRKPTQHRIHVCLGDVFHSDSTDPDEFNDRLDSGVMEDDETYDHGMDAEAVANREKNLKAQRRLVRDLRIGRRN